MSGIILREAVKNMMARDEAERLAASSDFAHAKNHSGAAIAAWHNREPQPAGILLPNRDADYFAMGFDAAMKIHSKAPSTSPTPLPEEC